MTQRAAGLDPGIAMSTSRRALRRAGLRLASCRPALDLTLDRPRSPPSWLTADRSSGEEKPLADAIERALRTLPHLTVGRHGNNSARPGSRRAERVILAGHIDTVPVAGNLPSRVEDGVLWGCGTSDMKSGVAVQLRIAATVPEPNRDLTFVFYDNEEGPRISTGSGILQKPAPLAGGRFRGARSSLRRPGRGGCQGTLRVLLRTEGERAHSARSWMGSNAIHAAAPILAGSPRTSHAAPSSTGLSTTRDSTRCGSKAASPTTSSPTCARWW